MTCGAQVVVGSLTFSTTWEHTWQFLAGVRLAGLLLLGDAVHAMLPHHGQGANTTIEDAATLAEMLPGARPDDLETTLDRYQVLRQVRTRTIQRSSWATNILLHLPDGPALVARDEKVARFPEDFGWIHEFDALRSASAGRAVGTARAEVETGHAAGSTFLLSSTHS